MPTFPINPGWMVCLSTANMPSNYVTKSTNFPPLKWKSVLELFRKLLGSTGKKFYIEQPFRCDYGWNIHLGEDFYCNYNCTILDIGKVTIGDRVMIAPNVSIYTAGHPVDPKMRASGYEYGIDISIGNDVWIGGNTVINPVLPLVTMW